MFARIKGALRSLANPGAAITGEMTELALSENGSVYTIPSLVQSDGEEINARANCEPTMTMISVTDASTLVLAASVTRRFLLLQNQETTRSISINFSGEDASVGACYVLPAGATLGFSDGDCTSMAINAINTDSVATAAALLVMYS